jgi:hypothetical protein
MFGGVTALEGAFELAQVFRQRRRFAGNPVSGGFFVQ